jgi:tRNA(Ile2) C34 agmatinyltransferase TiaS
MDNTPDADMPGVPQGRTAPVNYECMAVRSLGGQTAHQCDGRMRDHSKTLLRCTKCGRTVLKEKTL